MNNPSTTSQRGQNIQGRSTGSFPLDNLTYDFVTILYEKSKGLEAFDKYMQDAQDDPEALKLFEQMRRQDEQFIHQLLQRLELRPRQSGQQNQSRQ